MSRPIRFRSKREVVWAKEWIVNQVSAGRMPINMLRKLELVDSADAFNDFIGRDELSPEARARLQKSLSAHRARQAAKDEDRHRSAYVRKVNMEVTEAVRAMVHAVAASRGITTSELLSSVLEAEYDRLPATSRR